MYLLLNKVTFIQSVILYLVNKSQITNDAYMIWDEVYMF